MNGMRSTARLTVMISAPVPSMLARTLMRTLSQLSPSIRSSPPRPSSQSPPPPPSRMLPAPNWVWPAPSIESIKACMPMITDRSRIWLPCAPAAAISAASALSPRMMSPKREPDMPSICAKRFITAAPDTGTGASLNASPSISTFTPKRSSLERHPVKARHALELVGAAAADGDVVAAFADHFIEARHRPGRRRCPRCRRFRTDRNCRQARRLGCRVRSNRRLPRPSC